MTEALVPLLQYTDGLFPAGGFAHSFGLETYVHDGVVCDRPGLEAFVVAHLEGAAGPADAVAVATAVRQAAAGDLAGWVALDARLEAMKTVPETRAASRQMGRQTLRVAVATAGDSFLAQAARAVDEALAVGHHATVFGAVLGRAGAEPTAAAAGFLYATAAILVGAGLRLIALGQLDGQRVLAAVRPRIVRLAEAAGAASPEAMWAFNPGLELAAIRHAVLEARLFRS
jgi:urease accessory protein